MGIIDQLTSWIPIPANLFVCIILPVIALVVVIFLLKYFGIKIVPEKYKFVKPKNTGFFDSILDSEHHEASGSTKSNDMQVKKQENFYNKK